MKKIIFLLLICLIILSGVIYILKERNNRKILKSPLIENNSLINSQVDMQEFQESQAENKKVIKDSDVSCENKIKDFYDTYIESSDYIYTDNTVNNFTNEKYAIRKSSNEGCGRNGSLCNLVIKKDGENIEIIADLLFPTCTIDTDRIAYLNIMNNAELLEFTDKDNLLISFGEYDHCVNDSSIAKYNLKTKKLTNNLLSFSQMEKSCWDKEYVPYDICKMTSCLTFSDRITFKRDNEIFDVKNNIEFPYDVVFDVKKNYKNAETINLLINKEAYIFNFNTGSLVKSN